MTLAARYPHLASGLLYLLQTSYHVERDQFFHLDPLYSLRVFHALLKWSRYLYFVLSSSLKLRFKSITCINLYLYCDKHWWSILISVLHFSLFSSTKSPSASLSQGIATPPDQVSTSTLVQSEHHSCNLTIILCVKSSTPRKSSLFVSKNWPRSVLAFSAESGSLCPSKEQALN